MAKKQYKNPGAVKAAKALWVIGLVSLVLALVGASGAVQDGGLSLVVMAVFGFAAITCICAALIGSIAIGIVRASKK